MFTYESFRNSARENAELAAERLLDRVSTEFTRMKNAADIISASGSVQDFLVSETIEAFYGKAETISEIIRNAVFPITTVDSLITIDAAGNFYRFTGSLSNNSCILLHEMFSGAGATYSIIELDEVLFFCYSTPVFSIPRHTPERTGTVILLTNLDRKRAALAIPALTGTDTAVIYEDLILFSSDENLEGKSHAEITDDYGLILLKEITGTNLTIAAAIKSSALFPGSAMFLTTSLVLLATLLISVIFLYRYLSERQKLFNAEILKRNMQLGLLVSQIDAHFVVNVITSIRTLSMRGDNVRAEQMADGLAQIIKHRHTGDALCNIFIELEILEKYIALMNIRYDGKFTVNYDIDDILVDYLIPGLVLQPIVENALIHGLQTAENATLNIRGYMSENIILLEVSDNGAGIESSALKEIQSALEIFEIENFPEPGLSGVSLSNIQRRIRLRFGNDYGLSVSSALGEGTTVTVMIPVTPDNS
jgi:hypothetical protein